RDDDRPCHADGLRQNLRYLRRLPGLLCGRWLRGCGFVCSWRCGRCFGRRGFRGGLWRRLGAHRLLRLAGRLQLGCGLALLLLTATALGFLARALLAQALLLDLPSLSGGECSRPRLLLLLGERAQDLGLR